MRELLYYSITNKPILSMYVLSYTYYINVFLLMQNFNYFIDEAVRRSQFNDCLYEKESNELNWNGYKLFITYSGAVASGSYDVAVSCADSTLESLCSEKCTI